MNKKELEAFAREAAKTLKTEKDLNEFSQMLTKVTVEAALNAELDDHLGYERHQASDNANSRNGYTSKTLKTEDGQFELNTPRDREGSFEPQLVKKGQTRFTSMDDKILSLYAKGMTTREIVATFKEMYDADISPTLISKVTEAVIDKVVEWQSRPLDPVYPIVYLDCIVVKIRQDKQVINKAIYLALGVNLEGHKELLGMWLSENEGAKFWLGVLTELQNRGVKDILIACVDGLKGFPDAISAAFPQAQIQLCIVHMVRNSMKYVSSKHQKEFMKDLKPVYQAVNREAAESALLDLDTKWGEQYPIVLRSWQENWERLSAYFEYTEAIRRIIYTTNTVEGYHRQIRKVTKNKGVFPSDTALEKLVYLAYTRIRRKWTQPVQNWGQTAQQLAIKFGERFRLM